MKLLAGRPQDEQDVPGIVVAQHATMDWDYVLHVAQELEVAVDCDLLQRLQTLRSSLS